MHPYLDGCAILRSVGIHEEPGKGKGIGIAARLYGTDSIGGGQRGVKQPLYSPQRRGGAEITLRLWLFS